MITQIKMNFHILFVFIVIGIILITLGVDYWCIKQGIVPAWVGWAGYVLGVISILVSIFIFLISKGSNARINELLTQINELTTLNKALTEGNNELLTRIDKLSVGSNELLKLRHEEIIQIYGFSPLKNPFIHKDKESQTGFELFENEICNLVENAEHSVMLCLVTPLLHSLRMDWKDGYQGSMHNKDHWADKFCTKFIRKIPPIRKSESDKLNIKILYLEDDSLKKIVEKNSIPWTEYKDSISTFLDGFEGHHCIVTKYTIPNIPMYFAIIDSENQGKAKGVMAFFNYMDLTKTSDADKIAKEFQGFRFSDFQIIQYFNELFKNMPKNEVLRKE